jgi:hypothetical protein
MNDALHKLHEMKSKSTKAHGGDKKNGKSEANSLSSKIKIKSNLVYYLSL